MLSGTVIVGGNGLSLTRIEPGRILASDRVIRTNNFFFETSYHLGRRVDLAMMGGDPRVAPFMFETLWQCRQDYDLRGWTSFNPKVERAGRRRFGPLFQPMRYRDAHVEQAVAALIARYGRVPTTGIYGLLMGHALGAERIILAGLDSYAGPRRYPFEPGRHFRELMGTDLNSRGLDTHLHDQCLDKAVVEMLAARADVEILSATPDGWAGELLPLAPLRAGPRMDTGPRANPPADWVGRAGLYPIALLKTLRRASRWYRGKGDDAAQP